MGVQRYHRMGFGGILVRGLGGMFLGLDCILCGHFDVGFGGNFGLDLREY